MPDSRTLEFSLRLERLDDLFVAPATLPWSDHYAAHSAQPALEYIAEELVANPGHRSVSAVFDVPVDSADEHATSDVGAAIGRWASARVAQHDRMMRSTARRGLRFLTAGLVIFALAIGLSRLISAVDGELADTIGRGFEVFAWVVLWFPLDVLVFGMWQQRLDRRAAAAIGRMPIEIVTRAES